jgi:hypothetical protein
VRQQHPLDIVDDARKLALTRMRAEASAMGADGIIGVKLTIQRPGHPSIRRPLPFLHLGDLGEDPLAMTYSTSRVIDSLPWH